MHEVAVAERLPKFLESFENLTAHFDEHFGDPGSNARGDTFQNFALKVVSLTSEGQEFPQLRPSAKKSYDGGVDLYTTETERALSVCPIQIQGSRQRRIRHHYQQVQEL